MIVKCDNVDIKTRTDNNLRIECKNVNFYSLYMDNDLEELLKEIPLDELEKHIKERKEDE